MRAIAVDWSGDLHAARSHIWLAEAERPGKLLSLECGRDRIQLCEHLLSLPPSNVAIGLDFAFSFPAWFIHALGLQDAPSLWAHVAEAGEAWLATCEAPFWGRPGRPRPTHEGSALRRTDASVPRTSGIAPKSIFQIGGAGAVGTGSVRGMPLLHRLHGAGARIWPFTSTGAPTALEIYPRLMTGPVHKSRLEARAEYIAKRYPDMDPGHARLAIASQDAFDAAVSALVMIEHIADLCSLPSERDATIRLEGRIWHPNWREDG